MSEPDAGITDVSVRRRIHQKMDTLSNSERKVARALLAAYPAAGLTTVAELAEASGVSAPTVIRFTARLGFKGFPQFQKVLVHEVNEGMGSPLQQYEAKVGEVEDGVLSHARNTFHSTLEATFDELPEWEFERLVRFISDESRDIWVMGGRFSRLVAEYLTSHLQLMRARVRLVPSEDLARMAMIADANTSTVLIAFDYRRYDERTAGYAQALRSRGATVTLMTDNWLSPIAKIAQIVIPSRVDAPSPFDSMVPALAVTEAVIAAVITSLGEGGRERLALVDSYLAPQQP